MKIILYDLLALTSILSFVSCGTGTTASTEDTSASGAAAGAIGGALSGSNSTGTQAFLMPQAAPTIFNYFLNNGLNFLSNAFAATACPTYKTTGIGCAASGSNMWLTYNGCSFGTSTAVWTGVQGLFASSGGSACGTLSSPTTGTLTRQFTTAASITTPGTATVVSSFGISTTIDNSSTNLGNFNADTITSLLNNGYGEQVTFAAGSRTAINLQERILVSGSLDHTINGTLTISETAGASTRAISGSIKIYHNLAKVVGTAVFNSVSHSDSCCYPVGGSITTTFAAGSIVTTTTSGIAMIGKSETLTFSTTCGSATLVNTAGVSATVGLSRCF